MRDVATKTVTLTLKADAYDANDVLADTQEIANVMATEGGSARLVSMHVLDKDDNTGAAMEFFFLNASTSLGTEDEAVSISAANAANIIGHVQVPAANFKDLINSKLATVKDINLILKAAAGSTSLYFAVQTAGTPTQTASGIIVQFSFEIF